MEQQESCMTLAVLLVSAVAAGALGEPQAPTSPANGQEPSFTATARTVRVPVSILDKSGQPVLGLLGADFKVWEDGKRQKVTLFSSARQPMRIVLALDVSGSMEDKIDQVEDALNHFVDILEPKDEIMVLVFNQQVRILQDFTSDRELLGRVFTAAQPSGGTALYEAAYEAIRHVAKSPAESKAVVLVTDGVNTESGRTFDDVLTLAQWSEVPVFSIGLDGRGQAANAQPAHEHGGKHDRPGDGGSDMVVPKRLRQGGHRPSGEELDKRTRPGFKEEELHALADETGGRIEVISDRGAHKTGEGRTGSERLREAVESIALTLRHRYLLGYEPPSGKPGWRTLKVEVEHPSAATTRARKGYFAEK